MSVAWMSVVAVVIPGQKPLPPVPGVDVPLASIVALGVLVVLAPSAVPASRETM